MSVRISLKPVGLKVKIELAETPETRCSNAASL